VRVTTVKWCDHG